MKNAGSLLLLVSASALLLAACAAQGPERQVAPVPAAGATAVPVPTASAAAATAKSATDGAGVKVVGTRYSGTRRVVKDGVVYFCERPAPTGSHFIAQREQCYTEAQLNAVRARDQDFVHRQQALSLQTNTTAVTRTAISP
jgi:hypothetical protein